MSFLSQFFPNAFDSNSAGVIATFKSTDGNVSGFNILNYTGGYYPAYIGVGCLGAGEDGGDGGNFCWGDMVGLSNQSTLNVIFQNRDAQVSYGTKVFTTLAGGDAYIKNSGGSGGSSGPGGGGGGGGLFGPGGDGGSGNVFTGATGGGGGFGSGGGGGGGSGGGGGGGGFGGGGGSNGGDSASSTIGGVGGNGLVGKGGFRDSTTAGISTSVAESGYLPHYTRNNRFSFAKTYFGACGGGGGGGGFGGGDGGSGGGGGGTIGGGGDGGFGGGGSGSGDGGFGGGGGENGGGGGPGIVVIEFWQT